jgi:hypothetical protein
MDSLEIALIGKDDEVSLQVKKAMESMRADEEKF